jgi:hypothetical protein
VLPRLSEGAPGRWIPWAQDCGVCEAPSAPYFPPALGASFSLRHNDRLAAPLARAGSGPGWPSRTRSLTCWPATAVMANSTPTSCQRRRARARGSCRTAETFDDGAALFRAVVEPPRSVAASRARARIDPGERDWLKVKNRDYCHFGQEREQLADSAVVERSFKLTLYRAVLFDAVRHDDASVPTRRAPAAR